MKLCCISSGSSLFAKVLIYGVSLNKGLINLLKKENILMVSKLFEPFKYGCLSLWKVYFFYQNTSLCLKLNKHMLHVGL